MVRKDNCRASLAIRNRNKGDYFTGKIMDCALLMTCYSCIALMACFHAHHVMCFMQRKHEDA